MTLEILIAQYKEPEEVIKSMLDSIAIQQNIDFNDINVIIANDGSDVILSKEFLSQYKYNIDYYIKDHGGLSHTRNFLLDKATGDYIMFCDADDMFWNCTALYTVLKKISERNFDCLFSKFITEKIDPEDKSIYVEDYDFCVHGKVFRKQFLLDKNIRWDDRLITHDSRYFITLCQVCVDTDKLIIIEKPYYLWKYNKKSQTRKQKDWILNTFDYFAYSVEDLTDELLKRKKNHEAGIVASSFIYLIYFCFFSESWNKEENQLLVKQALEYFYKFYNKYKFLLFTIGKEELTDIVKSARHDILKRQRTPLEVTMTFPEWIKYLEQFK